MKSKSEIRNPKSERRSKSEIRTNAGVPGIALAGIFLCWFFAGYVQGAEQELNAKLDGLIQQAGAFEYGRDSAALVQIEQIVLESSGNAPQRAVVEERLLQLLGNAGASRDAKEFVCRQLFTVGSGRCVQQLEALLLDPELSHVARFALGRNESPEALAALLRSLPKASGALQTGILNTIGEKRARSAVVTIKEFLKSRDSQVAAAAAVALGRIGGKEALDSLKPMFVLVSENAKDQKTIFGEQLAAALLAAAEGSTNGSETKLRSDVYRLLLSKNEEPSAIRGAALRGLAAAGDAGSISQLLQAISGSDSKMRQAALGIVRDTEGTAATKSIAAELPKLGADTQVELMSALAGRGDPAAVPAILPLIKSTVGPVRTAAIETLGDLGDGTQVELLLQLATANAGPEQEAARLSLARIHRGDVAGAFQTALVSKDTKVQMEALRALGVRKQTASVGNILPLAAGPDPAVRRQAIKTLGDLGNEQSVGFIVELCGKVSEPADLDVLEQALDKILARIKSPSKQAAPILAALNQTPPAGRAVLLSLLSRPATPESYQAVQKALRDQNPLIKEAALRSLAEWPNPTPADELLAQVQSSADGAAKVIALRGYVRLAGLSKDPAQMYAHALEIATRVEDKKLVLSGLGTAGSPQALKLIEPYLADPQLRNEAALAAIQIAGRLPDKEFAAAKPLVKKALSSCTEPAVQQQGREVINKLEQFEGYILQWLQAGPFQQQNKDAHALFSIAFPPERDGDSAAKWEPLTKGIGAWDINLADAFGGMDEAVGYLRTTIWSPAAREAQLELSSDDGIKAWLNGKVVHKNDTERGLSPRQDVIKVTLQEGRNDLILKITNKAGGWACSCRVRQPDGSEFEGLRIEPKL